VKILKKLRTTSLNSEFTGSYKKVCTSYVLFFIYLLGVFLYTVYRLPVLILHQFKSSMKLIIIVWND